MSIIHMIPQFNSIRLSSTKGEFIHYIFQNKENRTLMINAIIAIIILIIIYKCIYPYASYLFGDSYCYIDEAEKNVQIDTYPIGYPMFLRAFSAITVSDTLLVFTQYFLLQGSCLCLLFTIFYFCNTSFYSKISLLIITVCNPVTLHLSNTVSSDNFFFTLSIIWFTLLIWMIFRPTLRIYIYHSFALFLTFTIRYNAIYYPLIAVIGILISKGRFWFKMQGILITLSLIFAFIKYNKDRYYELCKIRQFTPFSGWLMANNALYAYRYLPDSLHKAVPQQFQDLDLAVRTYFDSTRNNSRHPEEQVKAYHDYMWKDSSPLSIYFRKKFLKRNVASTQEAWATAGFFYMDYGSWIIRQYPKLFIKNVIEPNAVRWFTPPVEFLEQYNTGLIFVPENVKKWFHYNTEYLHINFKYHYILYELNNLYPIWAGIMNILFFIGMLFFIFFKMKRNQIIFIKLLFIAFIIWVANFCFSVFASPIALRFQMFPIYICTLFTFIIVDNLFKKDGLDPKKRTPS